MNETIVKTEKLTELKNLVSEIERTEVLINECCEVFEYDKHLKKYKKLKNQLFELIKKL